MKLTAYLETRGESQASFARRAGIKQSTLNQICLGAGMNVRTAQLIITASLGAVGLEDLIPEGGKRRAERRSPIGRVDAPDGDELSSHEPSGGSA